MNTAIKEILSEIIPIEHNHIDLFISKFKPVSYRKGDYFIKEGQVSRFLGFIIKGCLMCRYNKDGKEFIDEFCSAQSSGLCLLEFFISPRIFLFLIRFSILDRLGFVGWRFLAGTIERVIKSRKRSVTSALFLCCDLYFSDTRINTPSSVMRLLSLPATINFCVSLRQSDSCGDHNSSTRDSVLFTC